MTEQQPLLKVVDLYKHFGGLVAVDHVSMEVYPGEVVGLVGDNGAGKSTLIKMISGVYDPDDGQIFLEGKEVRVDTPMEARDRGIETIYQDLALCENLDASVNIFLGREPMRRQLGLLKTVDRKHMLAESETALEELDIEIPNLGIHIPQMQKEIEKLSGGQRQAVAIARAVYWNARLMIMDEPTAALAVAEQRKVLDLCRTLRDQGVPVIIISHNLLDVFAVADRIVVLRRARKVAELNAQETDMDEVVALMTGSKVGEF
jgi:ABC-type sugar transport system ATPase subunit